MVIAVPLPSGSSTQFQNREGRSRGFRFLTKLVTAHALDIGEVENRGGETVEHGSTEVVGHIVAKLVNIDGGHARPLSRIHALLTALQPSPRQRDVFSLPG